MIQSARFCPAPPCPTLPRRHQRGGAALPLPTLPSATAGPRARAERLCGSDDAVCSALARSEQGGREVGEGRAGQGEGRAGQGEGRAGIGRAGAVWACSSAGAIWACSSITLQGYCSSIPSAAVPSACTDSHRLQQGAAVEGTRVWQCKAGQGSTASPSHHPCARLHPRGMQWFNHPQVVGVVTSLHKAMALVVTVFCPYALVPSYRLSRAGDPPLRESALQAHDARRPCPCHVEHCCRLAHPSHAQVLSALCQPLPVQNQRDLLSPV